MTSRSTGKNLRVYGTVGHWMKATKECASGWCGNGGREESWASLTSNLHKHERQVGVSLGNRLVISNYRLLLGNCQVLKQAKKSYASGPLHMLSCLLRRLLQHPLQLLSQEGHSSLLTPFHCHFLTVQCISFRIITKAVITGLKVDLIFVSPTRI